MPAMTAIVIVEGLAIVLLAVLVVGLLRSHAEILASLHDLGAAAGPGGPPPPQPVPLSTGPARDLVGTDAQGSAVVLGIAGARHRTLLAFLSTTCRSCAEFWDTFATRPALPERTRLIVVVQDEDSLPRLRRLAGAVTVVRSTAAWQDYQVPGAPHFAFVDGPSSRVLGEGTGSSWPQVLDLMAHAGAPTVVDQRDHPGRIDAELRAAGVDADHPSLYRDPDPQDPPR